MLSNRKQQARRDVFKPLAVTVEVTPEMLQQLKQSATVSAQMIY
jgi:hypothetical protein